MKRFVLPLLLIAVSLPLLAFNPADSGSDRIVILAGEVDRDDRVVDTAGAVVRGYLARELRRRGFDAVNVRYTYEDLLRGAGDRGGADFYVELISGGYGDSGSYGGVGIGGRNGGIDIGVISTSASATVRLYDGSTFELIDSFDLHKRATAVVPTAVGVGGRNVGLWIAVPFVQYARYRAAARAVARDAAELIAEGRGEGASDR